MLTTVLSFLSFEKMRILNLNGSDLTSKSGNYKKRPDIATRNYDKLAWMSHFFPAPSTVRKVRDGWKMSYWGCDALLLVPHCVAFMLQFSIQ